MGSKTSSALAATVPDELPDRLTPVEIAEAEAVTTEATGKPVPTFNVYIKPEWKEVAVRRVRDHTSLREIASLMGFSYPTILAWTKKPLYQAYENWLCGVYYDSEPLSRRATREEVKQKYEDYAGEMQDRLLAILDVCDNKTAVTIAQDWLDRAGAGAPKELQRQLRVNISEERAIEFLTRAQEAGLIVDIKPKEASHELGSSDSAASGERGDA